MSGKIHAGESLGLIVVKVQTSVKAAAAAQAMSEDSYNIVKKRWDELNTNLNDKVRDKWWKTIVDCYNEPHRKHYTLNHIQAMLSNYETYEKHLQSKDAVCYAVFFYNISYDPKSSENEVKSIQMFEDFVKEADEQKVKDVQETVKELITLTVTHSTEEHKIVGAVGKDDKHFFLDFDTSVLGSSPSEYNTYAECIREEYSFLPDTGYQLLRTRILKLFLLIPNIFSTQLFRDLYEEQARKNIQSEIEKLQNLSS